jgi:small-conductance mechanosensitive channel
MDKLLQSSFWAELFDNGKHWLINQLPGLLIAIILFIVALKIVRFFIRRVEKVMVNRNQQTNPDQADETEKRIRTLMNIVYGITRIILWAVLIMIVLQKFGVNIAPILASAGIVGLAVGFGAQELVRDFISGFFMILENQIRTGDVAIINGTGGLVEKIELRTVTLRDISGVVHIFQNGKISSLSNMTKDWSAMAFDIGVAYKENIPQVINVMKEVGDELAKDPDFSDKILEPIEIFGLDQFGDSALVIKARLKTRPALQWEVGREYRKRLKAAFDEKNIEIPFPHTTLYWGDDQKPINQ